MKLGYAYAADKSAAQGLYNDLISMGAERAYVDYKGSNRTERASCFSAQDCRPGDVIILLDRKHLGNGREGLRLEAIAADLGATIEIKAPEKPSRQKPGPALKFAPNYEQERAVRHYWHGPFLRRTALELASKEMGRPITAAMLNRSLGPRSRPKPWINEPPEGGENKEE